MQYFKKYIGILFCLSLSLQSCYSLNGIALDPKIKTLQVDLFPNYATLQNATLSQNFTNSLRDRFRQQTGLDLVQEKGDIIIRGEIQDYRESYTAVTADNTSSTRLTIKIKVIYINNLDENKNFERSFEAYEDFKGTQTLLQVENSLVPLIIENLINQVYNAVANDW